jgi:ankyrin repeat protein
MSPDTMVEGSPAVSVAANGGRLEVMNLLLKRGADPRRTDNAGNNALIWSNLAPDVVQALTTWRGPHGEAIDLNAASEFGTTALNRSASDDAHLEVTKALIAAGAEVNFRPQDGKTALNRAIESSPFASTQHTVAYLLANGASPDRVAPDADAPIWSAALTNDVPAIEALGGCKVDLNVVNQEGETALDAAAGRGNVEAFGKLLSLGADPTVATAQGNVFNFVAQAVDRAKVAGPDGETSQFKILKALTAIPGVDPNMLGATPGVEGNPGPTRTPLMDLVHQGDAKLVSLFLTLPGVKTSGMMGSDGYTVLGLNAYQGSVDVAQALVNAKADMNEKIINTTPYLLAVGLGRTDLAKVYLSGGANPLARSDNTLFTAFHWAALNGVPDAVDLTAQAIKSLYGDAALKEILADKDNKGETAVALGNAQAADPSRANEAPDIKAALARLAAYGAPGA